MIGMRIGIGLIFDGLYKLPAKVIAALASTVKERMNKKTSGHMIMKWHKRLGHISFLILKKLFLESFKCVQNKKLLCNVCQGFISFPVSEMKINKIFSLVHSDVWDPSGISTVNSCQYFVMIIDD